MEPPRSFVTPGGATDRRVRLTFLACQADLNGGFEDDRHLEGLTKKLRNGGTGRVWEVIRATIEYTMVGRAERRCSTSSRRASWGPRPPLHIQGAGGADLRVFLRSGLNCWFPLPRSGQRDVGRRLRLLVVRRG